MSKYLLQLFIKIRWRLPIFVRSSMFLYSSLCTDSEDGAGGVLPQSAVQVHVLEVRVHRLRGLARQVHALLRVLRLLGVRKVHAL